MGRGSMSHGGRASFLEVVPFTAVVVAVLVFHLAQDEAARYNPVTDPDNFTTKIDNPFFPTTSGTLTPTLQGASGPNDHWPLARSSA